MLCGGDDRRWVDQASTKGFSRKRSNPQTSSTPRCCSASTKGFSRKRSNLAWPYLACPWFSRLNEGLLSEEKQSPCWPPPSAWPCSLNEGLLSEEKQCHLGHRHRRGPPASTKGFSRKRSNCAVGMGTYNGQSASTKGFSRKRSNIPTIDPATGRLPVEPQRRASLGREAIGRTVADLDLLEASTKGFSRKRSNMREIKEMQDA